MDINIDVLGLDRAVRKGDTIIINRAHNVLRAVKVIKVKSNKILATHAYGENISLFPALEDASKDYLSGGIKAKQYASEYYLGEAKPDSNIDMLILDDWVLTIRECKKVYNKKLHKLINARDPNELQDRDNLVRAIELNVAMPWQPQSFLYGADVLEVLNKLEKIASNILETKNYYVMET